MRRLFANAFFDVVNQQTTKQDSFCLLIDAENMFEADLEVKLW